MEKRNRFLSIKIMWEIFFGFVILFAHSFVVFAAENQYADLKVVYSGDDGIGVIYEVPEPGFVKTSEHGIKEITLKAGEALIEIGSPALPYKTFMVGIPLGAEVRADLSAENSVLYREIEVMPVPRWIDDHFVYTKNPEIYSSDAYYPEKIYEISKPRIWRGQRVVEVMFFPVRIRPALKECEIYRKMTINISWNIKGEEIIEKPATDKPLWDKFFSESIINYDLAKKWNRQNVSARMSQKAETMPPFYYSDNWVKMEILDQGLFRVKPVDLERLGIEPLEIDPRGFRIFNGGGEVFPENVDSVGPSLEEIPVYVSENGDKNFSGDEYIEFWAQGASNFIYSEKQEDFAYRQHPYSNVNAFFLTWGGNFQGNPLRIEEHSGEITGKPAVEADFAARFIHLEQDRENPEESGTQWIWDNYVKETPEEYYYSTDLGNVKEDDPVEITVRFYGDGSHHAILSLNDSIVADTIWNSYNEFIVKKQGTWLRDSVNTVTINIPRDVNPKDKFQLDWIELKYQAPLEKNNSGITFYSPGLFSAYIYHVNGFEITDSKIYKIQDIRHVESIKPSKTSIGTELIYEDEVQGRIQYHVRGKNDFRTPDKLTKIEIPGLRETTNGADLIIVTADEFYHAFDALKAHKEDFSGYRTELVKISDIYNEFSWGLPDPAGLRNFLKYAYFNWQAPAPRFVLLGGDGTFDMKNHYGFSNPRNFMPVAVTRESHDDWFVCVDGDDWLLDMSIGRINSKTAKEAEDVVEKIISYEAEPTTGYWKLKTCLVADDEVNRDYPYFSEDEHTVQTDSLINRFVPHCIDAKGLYLVDYPYNYPSQGKAEAREDFIDIINEGVFYVNYLGHGNESVLAHEWVFKKEYIPYLENRGMYPVFFIGSCSVGHFDRADKDALSEELVNKEKAGAIAVLAADGPTYSDPNFTMCYRFITKAFSCPPDDRLSIGDALMWLKNQNGNSEWGSRKQTLCGDPSLKLCIPHAEAVIEKVTPDSAISQLTGMTVKGRLQLDGKDLTTSGDALVTIFESGTDEHYWSSTFPSVQIPFFRNGGYIARGYLTVINGSFTGSFPVPQTLRSGNLGELFIYFWNNEIDGVGFREGLDYHATRFQLDGVKGLHLGNAASDSFPDGEIGYSWEPHTVFDKNFGTVPGDGICSELNSRAWVNHDIKNKEIIDGNGADLTVYTCKSAPGDTTNCYQVFGSEDHLDWKYLGRGEGTGVFDINGIMDKVLYLKLRPSTGRIMEKDDQAPQLELYAGGIMIQNKAIVASGSLFSLRIRDEQGIDMTGQENFNIKYDLYKGWGNDRIFIEEKSLTEYFIYDKDTFHSGSAYFVFERGIGNYTMAVSASDITGARATQNFEFEVLEPGDVGLEDVFAVPNPFRDKTHFVFKANMGIPLDLKIDIYTIAGRKIKSIENSGTGAGIFWQIEWDGRDDDGDEIANGVYFFKVKAKNLNSGTQEVFTGKLVKMK